MKKKGKGEEDDDDDDTTMMAARSDGAFICFREYGVNHDEECSAAVEVARFTIASSCSWPAAYSGSIPTKLGGVLHDRKSLARVYEAGACRRL